MTLNNIYLLYYIIIDSSSKTIIKLYVDHIFKLTSACPRDCDRDYVCITPAFSDPYCGCPLGMDEIDGKCVTCPSKIYIKSAFANIKRRSECAHAQFEQHRFPVLESIIS